MTTTRTTPQQNPAQAVIEADWRTILEAAQKDLNRSAGRIERMIFNHAALVEALEELSEAVRAMDSWSARANEALEGADAALAAAKGTK